MVGETEGVILLARETEGAILLADGQADQPQLQHFNNALTVGTADTHTQKNIEKIQIIIIAHLC